MGKVIMNNSPDIDMDDLAVNVAGEISISSVAEYIDTDNLVSELGIDANDVAGEISMTDLASEVVMQVETEDLANEIDLDDLSEKIDYKKLAQALVDNAVGKESASVVLPVNQHSPL